MDILLKSNSTSVYEILKQSKKEYEMSRKEFLEHIKDLPPEEQAKKKKWFLVDRYKAEKVEPSKGITVQETIIEYLSERQNNWNVFARQKFGQMVSNRRLQKIFDGARNTSDSTKLDYTDEKIFYRKPKRKTGTAPSQEVNVSSKTKKGKQMMYEVLLNVSKVVDEEDSRIVLAIRDFIKVGQSRAPTRKRGELESLIGGSDGLIEKLRGGRNVTNNNRYMNRLEFAGLFHDRFLMRLGSALKDNNQRKTFHQSFWEDLNSGDPTGVEVLREFLHSQDATIPDIEKLRGFHRQLISGRLFNPASTIKQILSQKEKPDEDIYSFENEDIVNQNIKQISEFRDRTVIKMRSLLEKFRDEDSNGYTDVNHETEIHNRVSGMSNRALADIDFDEEFGDVIEKDIGDIEDLWETLSGIREALEFMASMTNIEISVDDINELQQDRINLINSIANYSNYQQSHDTLTERQERGRSQQLSEQGSERRQMSPLNDIRLQYIHVSKTLAELPNKGYTRFRQESEQERNEKRLEDIKGQLMLAVEDNKDRYSAVLEELKQQIREEVE